MENLVRLMFKRERHLSSLLLRDCGISVQDTFDVFDELCHNDRYKDLNVLDMSHNYDMCPVSLASIVRVFPLTILDISHCKLEANHLNMILECGVGNCPTLARLDISYNPLRGRCATTLRYAICRNVNMVTLVLDGCVVCERDLDTIFTALAARPSITDVSICDIRLSRPVKALVAARVGRVVEYSNLSHLRLDASAFDAAGMDFVARGIAKATDLRTLQLGPTRQYPHHFNYAPLSDALRIVRLSLGHCDRLNGPLSYAERSGTLQTLRLSIRVADNDAYIRMAEAARKSVSLKLFSVEYKRATCSETVRFAFLFSVLESATIQSVKVGSARSWAPLCATLDLLPFLRVSLMRCSTLKKLEILDVAVPASKRYNLGIFLSHSRLDSFRIAGINCKTRQEMRSTGEMLMTPKRTRGDPLRRVAFSHSAPLPCDTGSQ